MKFLKDFKAFAMRGNVVDMAVGVIVGGAFGKIVSSLVADIIMPPIGLLVGGVNFTELAITLKMPEIIDGVKSAPVTINYGNFLQTVFDFIIIAFCIFMVVRLLNRFNKKQENKPAAPPKPSAEELLLIEIRDLLKERNEADKNKA